MVHLPGAVSQVRGGAHAAASSHGMRTHLDALDRMRDAFNPRSTASAPTRIRMLADIAELPIGVRPTPPDGKQSPLLQPFAHESTDEWAEVATRLRTLALHAEGSDDNTARAAIARIDELLGPSFAPARTGEWLAPSQEPETAFVLGLRHVEGATQPSLLPEQMPGQKVREIERPRSTTSSGIPGLAAMPPASDPIPAGQLLLGTEAFTRAVADAHAGAYLLDSREPRELDQLVEVLRRGHEVDGTRHPVGGSVNTYGQAHGADVAHDGTTVATILRPRSSGAAQEDFAWRLIALVRADAHAPAIGRTAQGDARMERRPGMTAEQLRLRSGSEVDRALSRIFQQRYLISPEQARERARFESQLLRAIDFLLADPDRNGKNVLVSGSTVSMIDRNRIGLGTINNPTSRPLASTFSLAHGSVIEHIDPRVVEHLQRTLTLDTITAAWKATIRTDRPRDLHGPDEAFARRVLKHVRRAEYPAEIAARLEQLARTNQLQWMVPPGSR